MTERIATLLWDASDAATAIITSAGGTKRAGLGDDRMRRRAIEREITILGDALAALRREAPELAARIPDIAQAIGMRNPLAHDHGRIDEERV